MCWLMCIFYKNRLTGVINKTYFINATAIEIMGRTDKALVTQSLKRKMDEIV